MRFATRTFLWSFLPVALLLTGSFAAIQRLVQSTVREGLHASLIENQRSIEHARSKNELQNGRLLKIVGENPSLKAGLQLLLQHVGNAGARLTVEDQLRELAGTLGFDFLMMSDARGKPLAGIRRMGEQWIAIDLPETSATSGGLVRLGKEAYQIATVPIDQQDENLGILSLGEPFSFTDFSLPAVLLHQGKIVMANLPGISSAELEKALGACTGSAACDVKLLGENYLSLPMESAQLGPGYAIRTLQSVDAAIRPVQAILRKVFMLALIAALAAALLVSAATSRSISGPIATVVSHLRKSERTGLLAEFQNEVAPVAEIRELTESFNRAAASIRQGRQDLHAAYVEFTGTLASALDARDHYTAGHSDRVSEISCAIARAMDVPGAEIEEIRIGALLHDIGKIGIADRVLQKPGKLTDEEFNVIKQHPAIGRRILANVNGFHPYLATVELHHENWDGTGYPWGLRGDEAPRGARIVHVSDAYDAMTTNRPYRRAMSHEDALTTLERHAGTQFDPFVVAAFIKLQDQMRPRLIRSEVA